MLFPQPPPLTRLEHRAQESLLDAGLGECNICGRPFKIKSGGLTKHRKACADEQAAKAEMARSRERREELDRQLDEQRRRALLTIRLPARTHLPLQPVDSEEVPPQMPDVEADQEAQEDVPFDDFQEEQAQPQPPSPVPRPPPLNQDPLIKIVHHPFSYTPIEMLSISDYEERSKVGHGSSVYAGSNAEWWKPFDSEADFDFVEYVTNHALSKSAIDDLLKRLCKWCESVKVSFKTHRDSDKSAVRATATTTKFENQTFEESYVDADHDEVSEEFTVYFRPAMEWAKEIASDVKLFRHWTLYPVKKYTVSPDGSESPIYDDPMCGSDLWDVQNKVGRDGTLMPLILYSDATSITRFKNKSFHPVVLRLASMSRSIRNGYERGGGVLIGHIPLIETPKREEKRKNFILFRRKIYHKAMSTILESLRVPSHLGYAFRCADDTTRLLYPFIYMISADFLEQADLSLTRGPHSRRPCSTCLIPNTDLCILTNTYQARTQEQTRSILVRYSRLRLHHGFRTVAEDLLRKYSLRPTENAFWRIRFSDPHVSLAFDKLHVIAGITDHFLEAIATYLEGGQDGINDLTTIDDRFSELPRFPPHPTLQQVIRIKFADHKTKMSILARILPCIWDMFPEHQQATLKALRLLSVLSSILDTDVMREYQIEQGRRVLEDFSAYLPDVSLMLNKLMSFIKLHLLSHSFDHIVRKGSLREASTKIGEHGHVIWKADYERVRRGIDEERQIGEISEKRAALGAIRDRQVLGETENDIEGGATVTKVFGSPQNLTHPLHIEVNHAGDRLYRNFHRRLLEFLSNRHRELNGLEDDINLLQNEGKIRPYFLLRTAYSSFSTLSITPHLLRANPSFHGRPCFDTVLLRLPLTNQFVFARLHYFFSCTAISRTWNLALVTLFATVVRPAEHPTGYRVVREDADSCFVEVDWIIRSALLASASLASHPDDYFVCDTADSDLYWRLCEVNEQQCI